MKDFEKRLQAEEIIVGDGGMGTSLQKKGLSAGEAPEKWNLEKPENIVEVHKSFLAAGADLIETNTFGANRIRLKETGLAEKMEEINKEGVKLAKRACQESSKEALIAGSMGPTGKMYQPLGVLSHEEALSCYREQISLLVKEGVDLLILETITIIDEMIQFLKAAADFDIPVIVQMNFREDKKTVMGVSIKEFLEIVEEYDVTAAGINCTPGPAITWDIISGFQQYTELPLSVFPNAGEPELHLGEVVYSEEIEYFVKYVENFYNYGVRIIGGCCGTTPKTIRAIRERVAEIAGEKE